MKIIRRLLSNLNSKKYSTTKLTERYLVRDYAYLKKAYENASNYIKIQAVDYMAHFKNQENLDYLIGSFKTIENLKLKSYTYLSILQIAYESNLTISESDELLLEQNINLLQNIGIVTSKKSVKKTKHPIKFRDKLKDHIQELDDKKRFNENLTGF